VCLSSDTPGIAMPGKEGVRRSVGHALFDLAAVRAYLSQA
jgi:hypothetical protein